MEKTRKTFVSHPTKKHLLIVTTIWAVGSFLLICAMTDFFQQPFVLSENIGLLFLIGTSTSVVIEVLVNYFKPKKME